MIFELSNIENSLRSRRDELMGMAILFVLAYHLYCWPNPDFRLGLFKYGFIGVDIFMLLSGFGLCYSFNKRSVKEYYIRRFIRLMPMYIFSLIFSSVIVWCTRGNVEDNYLINMFYKLTTLSYWGFGPGRNSWYVEAMLFLYTIFPIVFVCVKKIPRLMYIIVCLLSLSILRYCQLDWQHDCLVSRLPVFCFGIICYICRNDISELKEVLYISFFSYIIGIGYFSSVFLYAATICPMLVILYISFDTILPYRNVFAWLGRHSYEIFLSNGMVWLVLDTLKEYYPMNIMIRILVYVIASIAFGSLYIGISKLILIIGNK